MQSKIFTRLTAISIGAMLCACGGASSGTTATATVATTATTSATSANTGSVSAPFVVGTAGRYALLSNAVQSSGPLAAASEQDSNGVFTSLGSYTFTGSPTVTKDIHGDATYAIGRWHKGTVTGSSSSVVLTGTDAAAVHYLVYNQLPALPVSGSASCDSGKFTAPSAATTPSSTADYFGSATGSATLNFSASGAAVSIVINATTSSSGSRTFVGTIPNATTSIITGNYYGSGPGASLSLGDGGSGSYLILAPYQILLANGAGYLGEAVFHCK